MITRDGQGWGGDAQGAMGALRKCLIHLKGWEDFQEKTSKLGQQSEKWGLSHVLGRGNMRGLLRCLKKFSTFLEDLFEVIILGEEASNPVMASHSHEGEPALSAI